MPARSPTLPRTILGNTAIAGVWGERHRDNQHPPGMQPLDPPVSTWSSFSPLRRCRLAWQGRTAHLRGASVPGCRVHLHHRSGRGRLAAVLPCHRGRHHPATAARGGVDEPGRRIPADGPPQGPAPQRSLGQGRTTGHRRGRRAGTTVPIFGVRLGDRARQHRPGSVRYGFHAGLSARSRGVAAHARIALYASSTASYPAAQWVGTVTVPPGCVEGLIWLSPVIGCATGNPASTSIASPLGFRTARTGIRSSPSGVLQASLRLGVGAGEPGPARRRRRVRPAAPLTARRHCPGPGRAPHGTAPLNRSMSGATAQQLLVGHCPLRVRSFGRPAGCRPAVTPTGQHLSTDVDQCWPPGTAFGPGRGRGW